MSRVPLMVIGVVMVIGCYAMADAIVGSGGGFITFPPKSDLDSDSDPYWDGTTSNAGGKNIGKLLYDFGLTPDFWGKIHPFTGRKVADQNVFFSKANAKQKATLMMEIAQYAEINEFGWYDRVSGERHILFSGQATAGATVIFTPSPQYGYYIDSANGIYFTESRRDRAASPFNALHWGFPLVRPTQQHFSMFKGMGFTPGHESYWIGVEDVWEWADGDFQDMVIYVEGA